jgi:hypothetical protein
LITFYCKVDIQGICLLSFLGRNERIKENGVQVDKKLHRQIAKSLVYLADSQDHGLSGR